MWEPVTLPFTNHTVPTLPTADEIRACTNVLCDRETSKVVAFSDSIIVKFGGGAYLREGQTLIYLEKHVPDVPAPRLYAMYYDAEQLFMVMERVPGKQLDTVWPLLTELEKDMVTIKLCAIFESMRQAECPWPQFFGGLDEGGVCHNLLYSQKEDDQEFLGPFHSEAAFVTALTDNFRALVERNDRPDFKVRHFEAHLGNVLGSFRPTLTHSDLHKTNILLEQISSEGGARSFNVALVDWEYAGWYPDFWEFFCASSMFDIVSWEEDWCWRTEQFLQVWPAKTAMMRMLDRDMRI
ncbi:phosphotransferase enzyme family protein [Zymoseptoria brevis]|uniref:Phosphotransferase enzyme family protein n=1 Tax=Zymoseptoria brevis TaxID=1047168 RepID=A0A0F4GWW9_9PEZI|nr:phosphotransferase enzyme family protein [Zymoseptoria brevis]